MTNRFRRLPASRSLAVGVLASGLGAVLVAGAAAPSGATATADGSGLDGPAASDHVVFLALDGFDVEYLDDAPMPNLQRLITRGSLTTSTGVMTSITNPSWSSVATGAWPETHGNTAYWFDEANGVARGSQRDIAVPTIAQAIRAEGGTVLSSQWFTVQNYGTSFGDPNGIYTQPGGRCDRRVDDAVAVMQGEPVNSGGTMVTAPRIPEFIAVYCDTLDALGHAGGDIHPEIPDGLREVDAQIGRLVQATKDAGIYGRTTFVITGDHGMSTFTQGLDTQFEAALETAGYQTEFLTSGQSPVAGTDVVVVLGGVADVNIIGPAASDPDAVAEVREVLASVPHISAVYDKADQQAMHMSPNHGEFIVEPEDGYSIGATRDVPLGLHGTTRDLYVPLVLSGAGVRPHRAPKNPRHIDVAPTIAALLGIDAPAGAEGRVLTEAVFVR